MNFANEMSDAKERMVLMTAEQVTSLIPDGDDDDDDGNVFETYLNNWPAGIASEHLRISI